MSQSIIFDKVVWPQYTNKEADQIKKKLLSNKTNYLFGKEGVLFEKEFSKKQIQEKLFYALGFDLLLFFGRGINSKFNGLLGEYSKEENRIFIKPEKIGF